MKSNGFIKWILAIGLVAFVIVMVKSGSTPSDDEGEKGEPKKPTIEGFTTGSSGVETLNTILARDKERQDKVTQLENELGQLKATMEGKDEAQDNGPNGEQIAAMKGEQEQLKLEMEATQSELEKLIGKLNDAANKGAKTIDEINGGSVVNPDKPKNPLRQGDDSKDNSYQIGASDEVVWTYPVDQPSPIEKGVFIARQWTKEADVSGKVDTLVKDVKADLEVKPVFTIPENTPLINAKLASRIVAMVPKNGTVKNPMGFQMVVPAKILAANGFRIPQLKEANMGGYAVGNASLSCARGYITSFTFIFEDGRIAQVGSNINATGKEGVGENTLAVLTDTAGTECVRGDFHTDAPQYIGTNVALGAAAGAAGAYAGAQETVQKGNDSTSTSVTGDMGKYIAGQGALSGVNQATTYINQMWAETTDLVVVDIGTEVNVTTKKAIEINYDPTARKVVHEWQDPASKAMEEYWR